MQRLRIEFPLWGASFYPMQTAIRFPAVVEGQSVLCFIEVAALADNFPDFREGQGMETFERHRPEIESIAATMIANGYVNADNELFIRSSDFALFKENALRKSA